MQAPDWITLLDHEKHLETAALDILEAAGLPVFGRRSTSGLPASVRENPEDTYKTPYVDVKVTVGAASKHYARTSLGHLVSDTFDGQFQFEVVTNRLKNDENHGLFRARVRSEMMEHRRRFTEQVLPYHAIAWIREEGTTPNIATADNEDVSLINFKFVFNIRPEAFPNS